MFEDAVRYPWRGEANLETVLVGGVLGLLGFLVIPVIAVFGYLVRVIQRVEAGDEDPPRFEDWGELLTDGLVATVIAVVYGLVPTLAVAVTALSVFLPFTVVEGDSVSVAGTALQSTPAPSLLGPVALLAVVLVTVLLSLLAAYLLPAAVAAYALTGRFGAAFSPGTLRRLGGSRSYAVAWLVAFAVSILAQLLGGALAATVAGAVLVPFVSFYGNVAGAYAVGRGVRSVDLPQRGGTAGSAAAAVE